jgi:outer membrane protein
MKKRLMLTAAYVSLASAFMTLTLGVALGAGAAKADTLQEAMAKAYAGNPSLEAQRAALRAVDENVSQAMSGWRPTIVAQGSISRTNLKQTSQFIGAPIDYNNTYTPRAGQVSITQPIFSGFQTINNTNSAKNQVKAGQAQLLSAEQQILLDTVTAYVDVKQNEAVLDLNQNNVQVLERELEANQDRFRVGEITRTDVAQSKARLSRSISGRISAEANLQASRASYLKVVGDMPGTLETPPPLPPLPATEEEALAIALSENPVMLAANFTERAAHYAVKSQEGGLLPSVSVVGLYSKTRDSSPFSPRADEAQVTAQLTVPLYEAGLQSSRIRQSKEIDQQRRLEGMDAERQVREVVKVAWEALRDARGRIVSTRDQVRANEIALDGVKQEAAVGSRTTLDVLNSEQELLDSRVALVQAQHDQYVAAYRLLNAVGGLTAQDLALPVDKYYDPSKHYNSVRNQIYGWGTNSQAGWEDKNKARVVKPSHPVKWDEKMPDGDMTGKFSTPEGDSVTGGDSTMWDGIQDPAAK